MYFKNYLNEKRYSMGTPKTKYEEEIFKADQSLENLLMFMFKRSKEARKMGDVSGIYHDLYVKHAGRIQEARRTLTAILYDVPEGTE
jgi:hypothetical protein